MRNRGVSLYFLKQKMCDIRTKIREAEKQIILIDDAVDETTIELIENTKKLEAEVKIFSRNKFYINVRNIKRRRNFRAGFAYFQTNEFKDKYLLIDGKMLYLMTRPLKYNNRRRFYYMRVMGDSELVNVRMTCKRIEENATRAYRHF